MTKLRRKLKMVRKDCKAGLQRLAINLLRFIEFLVGEKILAAPVVEEGGISRNIYLPAGTWVDGNDGTLHVGPKWIENYPAPLDILPYFIRED